MTTAVQPVTHPCSRMPTGTAARIVRDADGWLLEMADGSQAVGAPVCPWCGLVLMRPTGKLPYVADAHVEGD